MKQIILIVTSLLLYFPINAQIGKKLLKRAEDKISQKAERTIDKIIKPNEAATLPKSKGDSGSEDSSTDSDTNSKGTESTSTRDYSSASGNLRAEYNFDFEYHMTTTSKDNEPIKFTYYFTDKGELFGFDHRDEKRDETMYTIMDNENKSMVMFMISKGQKSGTKMPYLNFGKLVGDASGEYDQDYQITKTGRTKTIAGYHCEEYKFESKKHEGTSWVSSETPFDYKELLNIKSSNINGDMKMTAALMNGIALEVTSYPKGKPHKATHMICTKFEASNFKINTREYRF